MGSQRWPRVLRRLQDPAPKWPGWQTALGNPRPKLLLGMKLEARLSSPGESVCPFCFQWHLAQTRIPVRFFWAQSTAQSSAKTSKCPRHTRTFPRYINKGGVSTSDLCPDLELKRAYLPSLPPQLPGLGRSTLTNPGLTSRLQHTPPIITQENK